jgi:hypothetical protein
MGDKYKPSTSLSGTAKVSVWGPVLWHEVIDDHFEVTEYQSKSRSVTKYNEYKDCIRQLKRAYFTPTNDLPLM